MRTHRFVGATSREVLHKVKQALGDDALILSNRTHDGGIEIVAAAAAEMDFAGRDDRVRAEAPAVVRRNAERPGRERFAAAIAADRPADRFAQELAAEQHVELEDDDAHGVQPEISAAFLDFVRKNERAQFAPVSVSHERVENRGLTPNGRGQTPAPVAPAPAVAIPVAVTTAAMSIPALVSAAVTRSTMSPAIVVSSLPVQSAAPAAVSSWPAAMAPAAPAASLSVPAANPAVQAPAAAAAARVSPSIDGIMSEIQNLKAALQRDIKAIGSTDAATSGAGKSAVMHELLSAGFSAQLSRRAADEVCAIDPDPTIEAVAECLERELWVAGADEIINNGGVYALVGPTGVGKTTTVAKLAARAVVRFGASKVALLTTDGYRVGAHDQLRIYGRILGVPVHAIRDGNDLAQVLASLEDRHLVLIDTIGMSQRDRALAEQAAMLAGSGDIKRLLMVQTTANARTLEQVVTAYKKTGIDGCILTKTDEAASIAPALDVVIRHQLPVHYVTDGQRVPEDLQLPDAAALVREALQPAADDEAFDLAPDELPFMMPSTGELSKASFLVPAATSLAAGVSLG
ncbi:MAG: flhF [Betaproteobacteria bacterium]|nr:flhF [Betaproteobacteria bacterium]